MQNSISNFTHFIYRFFCFNFYRIGVGIEYDWSCDSSVQRSEIINVSNNEINDTLDNMFVVSENTETNRTVFLASFPCEWGFHYLTAGAAVWIAFLPFYITQLLGNCWRQCCCCLCDPLVWYNLPKYILTKDFTLHVQEIPGVEESFHKIAFLKKNIQFICSCL